MWHCVRQALRSGTLRTKSGLTNRMTQKILRSFTDRTSFLGVESLGWVTLQTVAANGRILLRDLSIRLSNSRSSVSFIPHLNRDRIRPAIEGGRVSESVGLRRSIASQVTRFVRQTPRNKKMKLRFVENGTSNSSGGWRCANLSRMTEEPQTSSVRFSECHH